MTGTTNYALVLLDLPLPKMFDYAAANLTTADVGKRVRVPFGKKTHIGVIWQLSEHSSCPPQRIKAVEAVIDERPLFDQKLRSLLEFCSDYYHYPLGAAVFTALPSQLRRDRPLKEEPPAQVTLSPAGIIALANISPRAKLQRALRKALSDVADWISLTRLSTSATAILKEWDAEGWIERIQTPCLESAQTAEIIPLTQEQQQALQQLRAVEQIPALLFGITGSGKTEVYLNRVADALANNRQALLLVPEINLSPQLEGRVRARFPNARIACLNSHISEGIRSREWLACAAGDRDIILGTRMAIFTPAPRLGLIIIDEEHDSSYKQQESLRYSARDLAIKRAKLCKVPVLLGSATPALESWFNVQQKRYQLLTLQNRASPTAKPPALTLVDARHTAAAQLVSVTLQRALQEALDAQQQSLIFINQRGFAPVLRCPTCAWQAECSACSARLVWHRDLNKLICHHCAATRQLPQTCPSCGNIDLFPVGAGTQRIVEVLTQLFPTARIIRADRDSMARKGSWEKVQQRFYEGKADILVGTQLLTKGHHFPNLTVVGVLQADSSLFSSQFRAVERLFAQLLQVAGRAGRATKAGHVYIQTRFPEHPFFFQLLTQNFSKFADLLLGERRRCELPPFSFQALLRADATALPKTLEWLRQAHHSSPRHEHVRFFDPVPALLSRVKNRSYAQLLVQSTSRQHLQSALRQWLPGLYARPAAGIRWSIDVDPLDL